MFKWISQNTQTLKTALEKNLVNQARKKNASAFGKLYLKYLDQIYRYIYIRVNKDQYTAEDLTETVFFRAWKHIDRFKPRHAGSFKLWLFAITRNALIDHYRMRKQILIDTVDIEPAVDPSHRIEADETQNQIWQTIGALTSAQKEIVILRFIDGFSYREIAKLLKKDEPALRALQKRALRKMRNLLVEEIK